MADFFEIMQNLPASLTNLIDVGKQAVESLGLAPKQEEQPQEPQPNQIAPQVKPKKESTGQQGIISNQPQEDQFKFSDGGNLKTLDEQTQEQNEDYLAQQNMPETLDPEIARKNLQAEQARQEQWEDNFYKSFIAPLEQNEYEPIYSPFNNTHEWYRRLTKDGNTNVSLDSNLLGISSQQLTSPAAKAVYDSYFANNPSDGNVVDRGAVDPNLIDDGHADGSREALYMTGEQYIKYRNAGLPGRDTYWINPNAIYSKQDEMEQYGFIPYLTNSESLDNFHNQASANEINNLLNHVTNLRRETTDFDVDYNGEKLSGKDILRNAQPYARQLNAQSNDESRFVTDASQASEYAIPHIQDGWIVTTSDGTEHKFEGQPISVNRGSDGSYSFQWENGQVARFTDDADLQQNMRKSFRIASDEEADQATMWANYDPLELQGGQKIRADKAQELMDKIGNGQGVDYGPLNWNKTHTAQEIWDPGFLGDIVPWTVDMALGSAPLWNKYAAGLQGASNAWTSSTGMRPGYQNYLDGTYNLIAEKPKEDQIAAATAGSALMPVTEHLYGPLGGSIFKSALSPKPIREFFQNIEKMHPAKQYLAGVLGEALEEIPGNIAEEFMQGYSPYEWYANEALDENDEPIVDTQGHRVRDINVNDPISEAVSRIRNFAIDAPTSMLGGGILGGVMGSPRIFDYYDSYKTNQKDREENKPMNMGYSDGIVVPLTDEEIRFYNEGR